MAGVELFFQFCVMHAVLDFMLQPDVMASAKGRDSSYHQEGNRDFPAWYYWLGAHSLGHGGAVYVITGNFVLGVAETVLHAVIDHFKCERKMSLAVDQLLHLGCKLAYCLILV